MKILTKFVSIVSPQMAFLTTIKLGKLLELSKTTPRVSEEWGSGWTGTNFIVEIEETASASVIDTDNFNSKEEDNLINMTALNNTVLNSTIVTQGPKIIVHPGEVFIVGFVLILWVCAIMLFINRWGKIRMLEPYQPKFQQQHRSSCPLVVDIDAIPTHQRTSVSRMSMGLINNVNMPMPARPFTAYNTGIYTKGFTAYSRPRQNSVFVGANKYLVSRTPRKTRSAMDLHCMVLDESAEAV